MNLEECMWATCIAGVQNIRMWKEYFEAFSCEIIYGLNNTIGQPQAGDCELAGKLDGFAVIHGWSVENAGRGLTMAHRYVS